MINNKMNCLICNDMIVKKTILSKISRDPVFIEYWYKQLLNMLEFEEDVINKLPTFIENVHMLYHYKSLFSSFTGYFSMNYISYNNRNKNIKKIFNCFTNDEGKVFFSLDTNSEDKEVNIFITKINLKYNIGPVTYIF